jgi:transposase
MKIAVLTRLIGIGSVPAHGATLWDEGTGSTLTGQADVHMSRELALVAGRPCDLPGCVIEATGNAIAVVRMLSLYVARVIAANPLQVKAIAHGHVKTDKIDAGVLASLRAADFLPEVWLPDADTERLRRLVERPTIGLAVSRS